MDLFSIKGDLMDSLSRKFHIRDIFGKLEVINNDIIKTHIDDAKRIRITVIIRNTTKETIHDITFIVKLKSKSTDGDIAVEAIDVKAPNGIKTDGIQEWDIPLKRISKFNLPCFSNDLFFYVAAESTHKVKTLYPKSC